MKTLLFCLVLFAVQLQPVQDEPVVRLSPYAFSIPATDGGKRVELLHARAVLNLPCVLNKPCAQLDNWYVDVRNLGPNDVTIQGGAQFQLLLHPKERARIRAHGSDYVREK